MSGTDSVNSDIQFDYFVKRQSPPVALSAGIRPTEPFEPIGLMGWLISNCNRYIVRPKLDAGVNESLLSDVADL